MTDKNKSYSLKEMEKYWAEVQAVKPDHIAKKIARLKMLRPPQRASVRML